MKKQTEYSINDFLFLKIGNLWKYFWSESLAFKSICFYLFIEYFRPQSIFPILNFAPWAQIFLTLSLVGIFFDAQSKVKLTGLHILVLCFSLVIHLSFLVAYYIDWSIEYYIFSIQWIVVFLTATFIVNSFTRLYVFFIVLFLCSLKVAIGTAKIWAFRGFSFTNWGLMGPPGYFQNSGELAVLMLTLFPISWYLYNRYKNDVRTWEKYMLLAGTICPILTILGSSSRGAQLALAVQLIIMFYKKIFKPKVLISILVVSWLGFTLLPDEQKERFTSIGEDKSSIQRKLYWHHAWEMMKEHPVLGVGYYNFIPYYAKHYPEDMLYGVPQLPHNIFFQIGTDAGFTGLFFYMAIIFAALFRKFPKRIGAKAQPYDEFCLILWRALKLSVLGFVIAGQFVTIGYYPFLWILITFQTCLTITYRSKQQLKVNQDEGMPRVTQ